MVVEKNKSISPVGFRVTFSLNHPLPLLFSAHTQTQKTITHTITRTHAHANVRTVRAHTQACDTCRGGAAQSSGDEGVDITQYCKSVLQIVEPPPPARGKALTLNKIVDEWKKSARTGGGVAASVTRMKRIQCERLLVHMILEGSMCFYTSTPCYYYLFVCL